MFNKIVWATDGSENADRALAVAKTLARANEASIVVVHIVQRFATKEGLAVFADEEKVEERLERVIEALAGEGFDATLKVVNHVGPQPAHEIAEVAREVGADLIVVGTRGRGAVVRPGARERDAASASRCAVSGAGRTVIEQSTGPRPLPT